MEERLQHLRMLRNRQRMEEQIAELEAELHGDPEDDADDEPQSLSPDTLLIGLLTKAFTGGVAGTPPVAVTVPNLPQKVHLDDAQLLEMVQGIPPAWLKKAQKLDDDKLLELARLYKPGLLETYDEDTIRRALAMLKRKN